MHTFIYWKCITSPSNAVMVVAIQTLLNCLHNTYAGTILPKKALNCECLLLSYQRLQRKSVSFSRTDDTLWYLIYPADKYDNFTNSSSHFYFVFSLILRSYWANNASLLCEELGFRQCLLLYYCEYRFNSSAAFGVHDWMRCHNLVICYCI